MLCSQLYGLWRTYFAPATLQEALHALPDILKTNLPVRYHDSYFTAQERGSARDCTARKWQGRGWIWTSGSCRWALLLHTLAAPWIFVLAWFLSFLLVVEVAGVYRPWKAHDWPWLFYPQALAGSSLSFLLFSCLSSCTRELGAQSQAERDRSFLNLMQHCRYKAGKKTFIWVQN